MLENIMYKNPMLNNLSHLEELHDINKRCPCCSAKLFQITNYMDQELDGSAIVFCSENKDHVFEMDRRTHRLEPLKKPTKK